MSILDRILGRREPEPVNRKSFFKAYTMYQPNFKTWNGAVYESELVRSAIDAKARHIAKLKVEFRGTAKEKMKTIVKHRPNELMTWSQFLYRTETILECENTVIIVPMLNRYDEIEGFFPVLPSKCSLVSYNNELFIKSKLVAGDEFAMELSRCGILTKMQYTSELFGESNKALKSTMELVNIRDKSIEEAVKNSNTFQFMAQMNNFANDEDLTKEQERFSKNNLRAKAGMLLFPNTYTNVKQIEAKSYAVDAEQKKQIDTNVFDYFGVNQNILQNKATSEEMDAFFNGAIEPFAIQLSEVLTGMVYTLKERSIGNECLVTANRLQYMAVKDKINMATQLADRGMMLIDEARELFNYVPLPDGAGQVAPIRGEYYNVDDKMKGEE